MMFKSSCGQIRMASMCQVSGGLLGSSFPYPLHLLSSSRPFSCQIHLRPMSHLKNEKKKSHNSQLFPATTPPSPILHRSAWSESSALPGHASTHCNQLLSHLDPESPLHSDHSHQRSVTKPINGLWALHCVSLSSFWH